MYLANTVLQLLVYCPPFRELFGDLGRLQGQRERGVTDGSVTPLVDATVKFLDELAYKEKPPWTHQHLQQVARSKAREDEDGKEEDDSVQSTYVYDAMKEKRQFIVMRVRSCAHVVALFTDPCRSLCIG
jgi:ubiquitin carboxyl-terminal hydrolase 10